jgi:hypothetical protein
MANTRITTRVLADDAIVRATLGDDADKTPTTKYNNLLSSKDG